MGGSQVVLGLVRARGRREQTSHACTQGQTTRSGSSGPDNSQHSHSWLCALVQQPPGTQHLPAQPVHLLTRVIHDDGVCRLQVEAHSSRPDGEQEHKGLGPRGIELCHQPAPVCRGQGGSSVREG